MCRVGSAGAVHRLVGGLDGGELWQELLLTGSSSHGSSSSVDRGTDLACCHGGASSGDHTVVSWYRFAGHVCDLGSAGAVHRLVGVLDGGKLCQELQLSLQFAAGHTRAYRVVTVYSDCKGEEFSVQMIRRIEAPGAG
jgi:hypothetical protein